MNQCDGCTLCCKLLGVEEIAKPAEVWCPHCQHGQGCGIYAERPPSCRAFQCGWIFFGLAPELRPDRCHVVLDVMDHGETIAVHLDNGYREAHRTPQMKAVLQRFAAEARAMPVIHRGDLVEIQFSSEAVTRAGKSEIIQWVKRAVSRAGGEKVAARLPDHGPMRDEERAAAEDAEDEGQQP